MPNISSFCKGFFSIKKRVRCYYSDTIDGIEDDQDALEMELRRVRYLYNVLNGFASGFVFAFLSGFAVLMVGCAETTVTQYDGSSLKGISTFIIYFFFVIILFCQWFFLRLAYTYYEKMKIVEDKLEKIEESKSKCEEMKALEAELNEMKLIKAELEKINNAIQNRA